MASHLRHRSSAVPSPSSPSSPLFDIPVTSFLPLSSSGATWLYTTLALVVALLVLEQSVYRYKKKHLPGATWTIPLIGKFADSMKPTMEGYMAQWNSGALSAISVFNMWVSSRSHGMIIDVTFHLVLSSWLRQTSTRVKY